MISIFKGARSLFGSDKPKLGTIDIVKSQRLEDILGPAFVRTGASLDQMGGDIDRFRQLFKEQTPEFERYTREGLAQYEDIMGGRLEQQLRELRGREDQTRRDAAESAMRRITGASQAHRARLGAPTGTSSYLDALQGRMMRDVETETGLAGTAQERQDLQSMLQARLGTIGQREAMLDRLAQRPLTRAGMEAGAEAPVLQLLAALQQMDEMNRHRGLYEKRSTLDRLSDFESIAQQDVKDIVGLAGSIMPMLGGIGGMGGAAPAAAPAATGRAHLGYPSQAERSLRNVWRQHSQ